MKNAEPTSNKSTKSEFKWYALVFIGIMLFMAFISYLSVLEFDSKQEYLSSLTPQERADIAKQEAIEKQNAAEGSKKFWDSVGNLFTFPVTIPFFLFILAIIISYSLGKFRRFY